MNQRIRTSGLIATFLALSVLLQPLSPIANSVPGGVAYSGDTRSVPIFAVMQAGGRQPTQVISSGFLYSSRIVFTAGVQDRHFDQAKGGIYVGKPGSKSTDTSGRIKVIKAFYPTSGEAELNDFVIFVLERELAKVEPFPLLQVGQEANVREASVRGYGEYQDRCGPGAQGPCPEKPTSEISRQINVNVIPLSQAETLVGYERPQLMGQIILQNTKNAQDGVICRGDVGSPVIGNLGGTGVYLGAASRSMNGKICGAVGVEKVERDKPKVSTAFDGIAGITHIAPVYRFSSVIDEARNYAAQTPTATPTPTTTSTQKPKEVKIENSTWGADSKVSAEQHEMIKVIYPGNLREKPGEVTGFRIYNSKDKGGSLQAGQVLLEDVKCEFDKNTTCYLNKYRYLAFSHNQSITEDTSDFKGNKGVGISVAAYNSKGEGVKSNRLPFPICPRYIFIGMRGSGEKFSEGPIGATNKVVYELLRGHDKINFNILEDGVPKYKAVSVLTTLWASASYLTEVVHESTQQLAFRFAEINKVCNEDRKDSERTKFFLSGYSQGAYGVNDLINVWERGFGTEVPKVIAGVFLIANPAEPNTGIITAIDSLPEKKEAQATSLALCGVSGTLSNTLLLALEGGSRSTRKRIEEQNLVTTGIKNFTSLLANPLKILGLSKGPQKNDSEFLKEFKKLQGLYEKVYAEARKNPNLEDFPLCQLMLMNIILEAYDRKLETPRRVKVAIHFTPGDIVADALPLLRAVRESARVGGTIVHGVVGAAIGGGVVVSRGINIHTAYKNECSWAQEAIVKVVGPPTSQIHAQGSFVEQYLSESHPCRKS